MKNIKSGAIIEVNEIFTERIDKIFKVASEYGIEEFVKKNLIVSTSQDMSKIEYSMEVSKVEFEQYPFFQMKLNEAAFANANDLSVTYLRSYSYHGFHKKEPKDPEMHFIRFDFEPFKEKYAPVHINAPEQKWGDHLIYPDSTNLDISKMCCPIAIRIFDRYAKDKDDYPVNQVTNKPYRDIIEVGGIYE